jgi:hypothetical protein
MPGCHASPEVVSAWPQKPLCTSETLHATQTPSGREVKVGVPPRDGTLREALDKRFGYATGLLWCAEMYPFRQNLRGVRPVSSGLPIATVSLTREHWGTFNCEQV